LVLVVQLYLTGKLDNVICEMNRCSISLLGIDEVRWTGCGHFTAPSGELVIYSGGNTPLTNTASFIACSLRVQ